MWQRYPDAAAALVVSPTPYGTCADIEGIAQDLSLPGGSR